MEIRYIHLKYTIVNNLLIAVGLFK